MFDKYNKDNLELIVKNSSSLKEVIIKLGLLPRGGNYATIKKYLDKFSISYSHFNYREKLINNLKEWHIKGAKPLSYFLVNGKVANSTSLKSKLFKEGIKKNICEMCGQNDNWIGKKISLILDHIDGDYKNNTIDNLRILCPNCNASLDTHCGKNKKKEKSYCGCGEEKKLASSNCLQCSIKNRRKVRPRPSIEMIIEEVKMSGYRQTGRIYNVSDNTIRKWIKA